MNEKIKKIDILGNFLFTVGAILIILVYFGGIIFLILKKTWEGNTKFFLDILTIMVSISLGYVLGYKIQNKKGDKCEKN